MTNYEKGEKISFGEAIQRMQDGEICIGHNTIKDFICYYKINNGKFKYLLNGWIESVISIDNAMNLAWYTAKEAEEKFIPNKAELFGLWKHKDGDYFIRIASNDTKGIKFLIKEGYRPATEADFNEFYKKVVDELQK